MSAEQQLLDALKQYELGVQQSVAQTISTGQMDQLSAMVATEVSQAIPGGQQTVQAANATLQQINKIVGAGPYSEVARIGNDIAHFNITGLFNDVFNGRTFNTDQYWGAVYFYRYVVGKDVNNQNQIGDQDVITALKWFEDKLGVFISGREHLEALQKGVQQYTDLYGVNNYTTIDITRVNNAVTVMKTYMSQSGYSNPPGIWSNAVGVYDAALVGLVTGSPAWQSALNQSKQTYQQTDQLPTGSTTLYGPTYGGLSFNPIYVGAAVILLILILLL